MLLPVLHRPQYTPAVKATPPAFACSTLWLYALQVLCGTEQGSLLMWSGSLIKFSVQRPSGKPCHAGFVKVVMLDEGAKRIISAGSDG